MADIVVEFFGIARLKAGISEIKVSGDVLRDVLQQLEKELFSPGELIQLGQLSPHYRISLDGREFLSHLDAPIPPRARLILLGADIGG